MRFNFNIFRTLAARAFYKVTNGGDYYTDYSLEDVLSVFEYYFEKYEEAFNEVHPNIRAVQIERMITVIPFVDRETGDSCDIEPDSYEVIINKHFQTKYNNCDYNINHFFSGDIRLMRFYEELY